MGDAASKRAVFTIDSICGEHGITRQGYHAARKREAARAQREEAALEMVDQARCEIGPNTGTRKIYFEHFDLFRELKIGRDKLFELLRRFNRLVTRKRRQFSITHWMHRLRTFENLVRGVEVGRPNEVWVSDMTYVPVGDRFAYASIVTDAYSRKIVGYYLSDTLEAEGPLKALRMALRDAGDVQGLVHHSDRGIQYCSKDYVETLEQHGCSISMTTGGNPYENALAERINGTIKNEYMMNYGFRSTRQARRALKEIVYTYNERRPHLSLAYRKPSEVHNDALNQGSVRR